MIPVHLPRVYLKRLGWSYCNDSTSEIQQLSDPTLYAQCETFSDAYFISLIAFQTFILIWIHLHLTQWRKVTFDLKMYIKFNIHNQFNHHSFARRLLSKSLSFTMLTLKIQNFCYFIVIIQLFIFIWLKILSCIFLFTCRSCIFLLFLKTKNVLIYIMKCVYHTH